MERSRLHLSMLHRAEEVILLPPSPPPPPPITEEMTPTQPESSRRGTPLTAPTQAGAPKEADVGVAWPRGIQHLALALTQTTSLFEEPSLSILIAKNALRPGDHHRLKAITTDGLYDNIIHSVM